MLTIIVIISRWTLSSFIIINSLFVYELRFCSLLFFLCLTNITFITALCLKLALSLGYKFSLFFCLMCVGVCEVCGVCLLVLCHSFSVCKQIITQTLNANSTHCKLNAWANNNKEIIRNKKRIMIKQ